MDKITEINNLIRENIELGKISSKDISDTRHTFRELYRRNWVIFSVLCNLLPDLSWKSKKHFDNENDPMFDGDFIVGINTPKGIATLHIKLEYWDLFQIPEIERAPQYDHYSNEDVIQRLLSLSENIETVKQKKKSN